MVLTLEELTIRLFLAIVAGGLIGFEREYKNIPAGFRTHILVCIGATIISLTQVKMGEQSLQIIFSNTDLAEVIKVDFARLGAQVITGVGFLGAGSIIHTKGSAKGLTTAASLWLVACLGLSIGMGYYEVSIVGTIAIYITLVILKKFQSRFISKLKKREMKVILQRDINFLEFIDEYLLKYGITIVDIKFEKENEIDIVTYTLNVPRFANLDIIVNKLKFHQSSIDIQYK